MQCVAACCSGLQYVAVCCNVLQCVAAWCNVLHCVAVCCSVLPYVIRQRFETPIRAHVNMVWCSVLQRVAVHFFLSFLGGEYPT